MRFKSRKLRKQSTKFIPRAYQLRMVKFLIKIGAGGVFLIPGLGKTAITLMVFKVLKKMGLVDRLFIIAPLRVAYNSWPGEIKQWEDFEGFSYTILHGRKKTELLANTDTDIYIINPEGLHILTDKKPGTESVYKLTPKAKKEFAEKGRWMLAVDESTKFKNPSSQRFRRLKSMLNLFTRRYILTGTPTPRSYEDLFSQIYILDCGATLGRYITHYRNEYFHTLPFNPHKHILNPGADKLINDKLKGFVVSLTDDESLALPDKIDVIIDVTLPDGAFKQYKQLEQEYITYLQDDTAIAAPKAAAKLIKLRQFANGGVYDADGGIHTVHKAKTEAVLDLIDELNGEPLLIAYEFDHDRGRLLADLPEGTRCISGKTKQKEASEIIELWNKGQIQYLIAQSTTIAHGLNLQHGGRALALYGLTFDFEIYDQIVKRLHRSGQTQTVFIYHILANKTVDKMMMEVLKSKKAVQDNFLDAVSLRLLEGYN